MKSDQLSEFNHDWFQTTTPSAILPISIEELGTLQLMTSSLPPEVIPSSFPRPPVGLNSQSGPLNAPTTSPDFVTSSNINSSTVSLTHQFLSQYTPVWAVGIAIVIAVVCIGLNLVLVSAFCCYKRHKNRMRSENFTHIKTPTLHAFNPAT